MYGVFLEGITKNKQTNKQTHKNPIEAVLLKEVNCLAWAEWK